MGTIKTDKHHIDYDFAQVKRIEGGEITLLNKQLLEKNTPEGILNLIQKIREAITAQCNYGVLVVERLSENTKGQENLKDEKKVEGNVLACKIGRYSLEILG